MVVAKRLERRKWNFTIERVVADRYDMLKNFARPTFEKHRVGGFFVENGGPLAEIAYSIGYKSNSAVLALIDEETIFHYFKNGKYLGMLQHNSQELSPAEILQDSGARENLVAKVDGFKIPKNLKGELRKAQYPEIAHLLGNYL
ncbi:MAG: hypothetical protein ACOCQX_04300 [Candidatus Nanoarchaeia archaeon]